MIIEHKVRFIVISAGILAYLNLKAALSVRLPVLDLVSRKVLF